MIVLLDSNVWVSSFLNPHGYPAKLKYLWLQDKFNVLISPTIVEEIHTTLNASRIKNKYQVKNYDIELFLELLILKSITVFPVGEINLCRDIRDNHILEAALIGKAEFIISRDDDIKRDLSLIRQLELFDIRVLSVKQFIDILER